jgi:hypothetical protein
MKRLAVSLCALAVSTLVASTTAPRSAEARPICPRGQTFENCIGQCPSDIVWSCASSVGIANEFCPVDPQASSCVSDQACSVLNPTTPNKITCTWYP